MGADTLAAWMVPNRSPSTSTTSKVMRVGVRVSARPDVCESAGRRKLLIHLPWYALVHACA
eukprot:10091460-Alexandrium_andersonii.AAC.1